MNSYFAGMLAGIPLAIFAAGGLVGPTLSPVIGSGGSATIPGSLTNIIHLTNSPSIVYTTTYTNNSGGVSVVDTRTDISTNAFGSWFYLTNNLWANGYYTLAGNQLIGNDGSTYITAGPFVGNNRTSGGGTIYYATPNGAIFVSSTCFGYFSNGIVFFDGQGNTTAGGVLATNAATVVLAKRTDTTADATARRTSMLQMVAVNTNDIFAVDADGGVSNAVISITVGNGQFGTNVLIKTNIFALNKESSYYGNGSTLSNVPFALLYDGGYIGAVVTAAPKFYSASGKGQTWNAFAASSSNGCQTVIPFSGFLTNLTMTIMSVGGGIGSGTNNTVYIMTNSLLTAPGIAATITILGNLGIPLTNGTVTTGVPVFAGEFMSILASNNPANTLSQSVGWSFQLVKTP